MKSLLFIIAFFLAPTSLFAEGEMVLIPATKGHPAFYMDITEATQGDYMKFQQATIFKRAPEFAKKKMHSPNHPIRLANWFHAAGFCDFTGKRLPTQVEWEIAAGKGKRIYPWGDEKIDPTRANFCDVNCVTPWRDLLQDDKFERYAPAGSFPAGATPEGILDMSGNLWEWTSTIEKTGKTLGWKGENYENEELRYDMVIKGGSYGSKLSQLKNDFSTKSPINFRSSHVGFRCAKDAPKGAKQ